MTDTPEYILERVYDAPRNLVWRTFSEPELLARWYGPGVETVIHEFDLRPGGRWLNEMKFGEKSDLSRMDFQEVVAGERLVWHHASTDSDWNIVANPMMENWPRVFVITITLSDADAGTAVRLSMVPLEASEAELAIFAQAMGGMDKGWGSGFALIAEILAELQG